MFDNDDLFDFAPDMDFDGDSDLQDALFLEDILEEEEKLTTSRHTMTPERFHVKNADEEDILFEYGIDPDDYITRAEYEEAVFEAKYGWRENAEDGWDYSLDPEDFENEEEYLEALESAIEKEENSSDKMEINIPIKISLEWSTCDDNKKNEKEKHRSGIEIRRKMAEEFLELVQNKGYNDAKKLERCKFIVDCGKKAAKYLTPEGMFLYAQAIKDKFNIHFDIEEEIDSVKLPFSTFLLKMARHDMYQSINIWQWCLHTFMPYIKYAENGSCLNSYILEHLSDFPNRFPKFIVSHMDSNPNFVKYLLSQIDLVTNVDLLIETALEQGYIKTAKAIIECVMSSPNTDTYDIENLTSKCIDRLRCRDDLEPMELFRERLYPNVLNGVDAAISAEYIKEMEVSKKAQQSDSDNMIIYSFCKVMVNEYYDAPYYYYFTGDLQLEVGDYVMVPFGRDNSPTKARVMSEGKCYGCAFPCHVSKIKTVVKKLEREK